MDKVGYLYIMASRRNGTLYLGVTSDFIQRVYQHREGLIPGFTRKYGCKMLVWYQAFEDLDAARHRELQMKEWKRAWKLRVIEEMNPNGDDLYESSSETGHTVSRLRRGPSRESGLGPGLRRDTKPPRAPRAPFPRSSRRRARARPRR